MNNSDSNSLPSSAPTTATSTDAPNVPVLASKVKRTITRQRISPERLALYVQELSESGSHFSASRAATPHPNERQLVSEPHGSTPPAGYTSFARERKLNPEFAEACEIALQVAVGRAEKELNRRAYTPTLRPYLDKAGNVKFVSEEWRDANIALYRFLARHQPDQWAERSRIQSDVTVTNTDAGAGGSGYLISIADVRLLEEDERQQLMGLLRRIEDVRQQKQLPDQSQSDSQNGAAQ